MNQSIPIFNRLVVERDLKKKYYLHKQKINEIHLQSSSFQQSCTSTRTQVSKSQINRKALMMEEQRRNDIDKANILLLSKLSKIMNKSSQPMKQSTSPTLNREFRIKKLTRISEENQAMFTRLVQQKGQYGADKDLMYQSIQQMQPCRNFSQTEKNQQVQQIVPRPARFQDLSKQQYFMTNISRFKPISWEDDRRSHSNQVSQTNKNFQENLPDQNSLSPSQNKEDTNLNSSFQTSQQQVPTSTIKRRHLAGNKFYEIEIKKSCKPFDSKQNFEIRAVEEQSQKVFSLQINASNANQLFSNFDYNLDSLISRIRFFKDTMIICPPDFQSQNSQKEDISKLLNSNQNQALANSRFNDKDLERIYFQKNELHFIEQLKPKRKKLIIKETASEKRKNLFSREMYRKAQYKSQEHQKQDEGLYQNSQLANISQYSPKNHHMKVSEVLETESSMRQRREIEQVAKQQQETAFIEGLIENQIRQSNESMELQETQQIDQNDKGEYSQDQIIIQDNSIM